MNEHRSTTGRPVISLPHQEGDVGDFLKDFACTAVMAQPLLAQLVRLSTGPTQLGLAILDNLVKYMAPAFIFGILYTTIRTHSGAGIFNYRHYLRQQWAALFWPTIYWTGAYLLLLPKLQQEQHYHNWTSFAWRFVNGNAAPHLWYNTMMLQFIILMPCFWALHRLVGKRPQRGWVVAIGTALITLAWLALYQHLVGQNPGHWYLLDRVWVSFLIYAVGGILLVNFRRPLLNVLLRFWLQATVFTLASLAWMIVQMGGRVGQFKRRQLLQAFRHSLRPRGHQLSDHLVGGEPIWPVTGEPADYARGGNVCLPRLPRQCLLADLALGLVGSSISHHPPMVSVGAPLAGYLVVIVWFCLPVTPDMGAPAG
ncbi:hypothetical protein PS405_08780 [Limosilactobacillus fermentum]